MTGEPATTTRLTPKQQSDVLYWRTIAKIPIIPCDSKVKGFSSNWKNGVDFSTIDFVANLKAGKYDKGIALVLGKTLSESPYPYSFALDFDGLDAVIEFFGSWDNVQSLSKKTRIEWHQDKGRLHIVFFSEKDVTKRKIKVKEAGAAFEVKCDELLIVSPSIHGDGNRWDLLPGGTDQITILDEMQLLQLEAKIDSLSQGYMLDENKQRYIAWLEDPNTKIKEHEGRHDAVKILGCSYYYRYNNGWKDLTDDQRCDKLQEWNLQHCEPPLPEAEFSEIWKWIVKTHRKTRDKQLRN